MSTDVSQLVITRFYIEEKKKDIKRLEGEVQELQLKLERLCTHPTIVKTTHYTSGGYDYVSEVTIAERCITCDKVVKTYKDPNHKGTHA